MVGGLWGRDYLDQELMRRILAAVLVLAAPLHAQGGGGGRLSDTTASIRGTAISGFDGHPLSGVLIAVPKARTFVVTNATGSFYLAGLPVGVQKVRISYDGRVTDEYDFVLVGHETKKIAVLLDAAVEDLAPVVVEAQYPDQWRDLGGFFARLEKYRGFARFFTRAEIERLHPPHISSLLAMEQISTQCFQGCRPIRVKSGRPCVVTVSVDDLPLQEEDYDRIKIADVAAIEVYRGNPPYGLVQATPLGPTSSVWQGESGNSRSCGAVLIWTR